MTRRSELAGQHRSPQFYRDSPEAEAGQRSVNSARQRTASQCAKRREAVEHLARVDRILSFFQHGDIAPEMSERDIELCESFEQKLRARGQPSDPPFA